MDGRSWPPPALYLVPFVIWTSVPPGLCRVEEPKDSSETYVDIKKNLIRLIDEDEEEAQKETAPQAQAAVAAPRRFKVRNDKLRRRALAWNRFVKKLVLLFLLRNDNIGHCCFGAICL